MKYNTLLLSPSIVNFKNIRTIFRPSSECDIYFEPIPITYDPREQFSDFLSPIYDQGLCGSCWAFATVSALSDNFAMFNSQKNTPLSAEYLIYCDRTKFNGDIDKGCTGNSLIQTWNFLVKAGTLTESCMHYTLKNNPYSDDRLLLLNHGKELQCNMKYCPDTDENSLHNEAFWYRVSQAYIIPGTVKQHPNGSVKNIKEYLYNFGSITSAFIIYDFIEYWQKLINRELVGKDLVYTHTNNKKDIESGGHAVKIIGWVNIPGDNKIYKKNEERPFAWLVVNSWGSTTNDRYDWGNNGHFLMEGGKDLCGIESNCTSGLPILLPNALDVSGKERPSSLEGYICGVVIFPITDDMIVKDLPARFPQGWPSIELPSRGNIGKVTEIDCSKTTSPIKCPVSKICVTNIKACSGKLSKISDRVYDNISKEHKEIIIIKIIGIIIFICTIIFLIVYLIIYLVKQ